MNKRYDKAFTLLELLTVFVIVGVLIGLVIPVCVHCKKEANKQQIYMQLADYASALRRYYDVYRNWPECLNGELIYMHEHLETVVGMLSGDDDSVLNPRGIEFYPWNGEEHRRLCATLKRMGGDDRICIVFKRVHGDGLEHTKDIVGVYPLIEPTCIATF